MAFTALFMALVGLKAASPLGGPKPQAPAPKTKVAPPPGVDPNASPQMQRIQARRMLQEARRAAAKRTIAARQAKAKKDMALAGGVAPAAAAPVMNPRGIPDYLGGTSPNWALSPLPSLDAVGSAVPGTGIRKFVHTLPGLGPDQKNDLGNYLPIATKDTTTYPGSDYYEIGLTDYTQQLHADLPAATRLRGYVDLAPGADSKGHYLGPVIIAERNRPVRVKFTNLLPTSTPDANGPDKLFLPVDTTAMGAGTGPLGGTEKYTENRAELHLHGGASPWISDGTPHQWIVPAGDPTNYKKGVSQINVPDMPAPGDGSATYYYTNQQSGRLMFYHDHTFGMTRLNVYAGEAAGYLIKDPVEDGLIDAGVLPGKDAGVYRYGIPLIIQDKTFVPDTTALAAQDPTWDLSSWSGPGGLWYPHVYMPNQNPSDISGANGMGRWDYGPWFWPPLTAAAGLIHTPIPGANPGDPETPAFPNPSLVPEAFMDTPIVNGTPYPVLNVEPKAYRFRILNAANDRMWNLSFFQADPNHPTEVKMVPAAPGLGLPANWPTDGRDGGVPDPTLLGPAMVQIGNESGFLPQPVKIEPTPVGYNYNRRDIVVLNIATKALLLGPAERADVIVDFSAYAGKTLILYNDAPAPTPAFDTRYDYYTGDPDQTETGGAPTTLEGYGPNTRTIMQIKVGGGAPAAAFDETALTAAFTTGNGTVSAYSSMQHAPILAQSAYSAAVGTTLPDNWARIQDNTLTPKLADGTTGAPMNLEPKAIQELFELDYGRMNATLGVELPFTNFNVQTTIPLGYGDPGTEHMKDGQVQLWKITHNGVDTHPVHFHLFDVQIVNRVGWDGAVRLPDPNEIGWKETVRMNPLEDIIVAMRPVAQQLPFDMPDSVRPLDPTKPAGAITVISPVDGNPITVNNDPVNMGWEYVWHCHILGHEENDFMRTIKFEVPQVTISGRVTTDGATPIAGATLTISGGATATTDANGTYSFKHSAHWVGSVRVTAMGYTFTPSERLYTDVTTDQAGQDFTAIGTPMVAGMIYTTTQPSAPVAGVTLTLDNGGGTTTSDANGAYQAPVASGWTGTITPSKAGFLFTPGALAIGAAVTGPLTNQNFTATPVVIVSGHLATTTGSPLAGVVLTFSNNGGSATTDATGNYTATLPLGWTGVATPALAGYQFTPAYRSYANLAVDTPNQDFAGRAIAVISGRVAAGNAGLAGVTLTFAPGGTITTDANGAYSMTLDAGWSGSVTPTKANYTFNPGSRTYANLTADQANQDYLDTAVVTFSGVVTNTTGGNAPVAGVTLTFTGGATATTDAAGAYSLTLPAPWTGSMTPTLAGFVFTPASRSYTAVTVDQANQNFGTHPVVFISGQVLLNGNAATPLSGATVQFSTGEITTTDANGTYRQMLNTGWTGTITASKAGYFLSPLSLSLAGVVVDTPNQNFTAVNAVTIYGRIVNNAVPAIPLAGVTVTFSNGAGAAVTDADGVYTQYVPSGYTGTATPSLAGYVFTPASRTFTNLTNNPAGQNFTARAVVTVKGLVTDLGAPLAGVNLNFNNGGGNVTTGLDGSYSITLNAPYTGTITPSLTGRRFAPATLSLSNVTTNLVGQNFQTGFRIAGRVTTLVNGVRTGIAGVALTLGNGTVAITNANGNYSILVPSGYTGTLTPSLTGKTFTPGVYNVNAIAADATVNFTAQ